MIRKLSCILLLIPLFLSYSSYPIYAQQQNNYSFFFFFKNYVVTYNRHVLAAPTLTSTPTVTPTPLPTIQPTQTPTPTLQSTPSSSPALSDVSSYLLQQVNDYRSSLGLSPVKSSKETCSFAATRAQEISNGFNYDGFNNRISSHTLPYASWTRATENIAQAPDYKEVVTLWKNSPGHAANMRDNTPYVCIMQYDSYYAYEGMRP